MRTLRAIFFISAMIFIITATNGQGANWVYYSEPEDSGFKAYYDSEGIITTPEGTKRVWNKYIFSDSGRTQWFSFRTKARASTEGYENLGHTISLYEIDCEKKEFGGVSGIDYSLSGQILDQFDNSRRNMEWTPIPPESMMDTLSRRVCKPQTTR